LRLFFAFWGWTLTFKALGAKESVALQVAGNSRRWWLKSDLLLKTVLTMLGCLDDVW
jgi:hypothetical protein